MLLVLSLAVCSAQNPPSFSAQIYPLLKKAGCQTCHHRDGVSSATRLHFPEEDAPAHSVEAFGKSQVDLVDRRRPDSSLLWNKPTNRIKHSGGELIKKGSREEARATTARSEIKSK